MFRLGPDADVGPIKNYYVNRDGIIRIVEPERNSPTIQGFGVKLGVVQLTLVGQNGKIKAYTIRITPNLDFLRELTKRQFPLANLRLEFCRR